jgi:hypothetical protein
VGLTISKHLSIEKESTEDWLSIRLRIANWSIACAIAGAVSYFHFFRFSRNLPPGIDTWSASIVSLCFTVSGLLFFLQWGLKERTEIKHLREELEKGQEIASREYDQTKFTDEFSWYVVMLPIFLFSVLNLIRKENDPQLAIGYYFIYVPFWGVALWTAQNYNGRLRSICRIFLVVFSALVILKFVFGK